MKTDIEEQWIDRAAQRVRRRLSRTLVPDCPDRRLSGDIEHRCEVCLTRLQRIDCGNEHDWIRLTVDIVFGEMLERNINEQTKI